MLVLSCKPLFAARILFLLCEVFFFGTAQSMAGQSVLQTKERSNIAGELHLEPSGKPHNLQVLEL